MIEVFTAGSNDIGKVLYVSILIFLFPFSIVNKYAFARLTNTSYIVTVANVIDISIVVLMAIAYEMAEYYRARDLRRPLFGKKEDSLPEIKFFGNILEDIVDDNFHFDYLIAAVTALLWFRVCMMMRLTEFFGPSIVMVWHMMIIIFKVMVIIFDVETKTKAI